jgi:predicted metal-dependent phosphotriesterase family hydrolase
MKANPELIEFIHEARRKGFDDSSIKKPLIDNGWSIKDIQLAFDKANKERFLKEGGKNKITIYLSDEILLSVSKRAKKNLFSIPEQVEDIVRRSSIHSKNSTTSKEKLDDLLVSIFSRKKTGRKK